MFELFDISKEEQESILKQVRRVLSGYRQLKRTYQLAMPQAHTQQYDTIASSKSSQPRHESPELMRYLELGKKVADIEQVVSEVENSEYIKNKYMITDKLNQWQLADLSGYSETQYKVKLRKALLEFAVSYGIFDITQFSFKADYIDISRAWYSYK